MKLPWLTEDQRFGIGSPIILICAAIVLLLMTGCASVFYAPAPAPAPAPAFAPESSPVGYLSPSSRQEVLCYYEHEGTAWLMRMPRSECKGWTPL